MTYQHVKLIRSSNFQEAESEINHYLAQGYKLRTTGFDKDGITVCALLTLTDEKEALERILAGAKAKITYGGEVAAYE